MTAAVCQHCQTPLPDGTRFCPVCGADSSDPTAGPRAFTRPSDVTSRLKAMLAGRYELGDLLGRGGMGAVYLATDLALDRQVAIKVLPPDIAHDETFVQRFEHEARTAAKLDHPGIIPIYAVEAREDLHYFVMKYVSGRSLDGVLTSGQPPTDFVQRILWEAACALGHAHQRGIVHRDIKPANIMIDEGGRALLTDFGISKALESVSQLTATGQVLGTPHYMSPEQAKGGEITGAADQYSLAVVGYRMLTGRLPFEDDSVHTVMYKHIFEDPAPLTTLRPDCPPFLAKAVHRGMAKDPSHRFTSMEAFATAVWPEHPVDAPSSVGRAGAVPPKASSTEEPTEISAPTQVVTPKGRRGWTTWLAAAVVIVAAAAFVVVDPLHLFTGAAGQGGSVAGAAVPAESTKADTGSKVAVMPPPPDTTKAASQAPVKQTPPPVKRQAAPPPKRTASPTPAATTRAPVAQVGYLSVQSTPFGTVWVDGARVDDTPIYRHSLSVGRHIVEIRHEGYVTVVDTVQISPNTNTRRTVTLTPTGGQP